MTDKELKALVASLAIDQKETDRQMQETDRQQKEFSREWRQKSAETDRQLKNLGKEIGGLGNTFGRFTEGFLIESLESILLKTFHLQHTARNLHGPNRSIEYDLIAYENTTINTVIAVEIKTQLTEDAILQVKKQLKAFPSIFPEHKDKKLYGAIAAVTDKEKLHPLLWKEGLYYFCASDDVVKLKIPKGFKPKNWAAAR
jgi:hypothetical protein